jgi:GAF domain-containing protein
MYDPTIVDVFFAIHEAAAGQTTSADANADIDRASMPRTLEPRKDGGGQAPLRGFYDLGRTLSQAQSVAEIGETLWMHLGGALPAGTFVLYTYDGDTHSLVAGYCNRAGVVFPETRVALGEGLSGWVAATGQAMVNADPRLDLPDTASGAADLQSALAVASSVGDRLIAVLTFYSGDLEAFSDAHRHVAEAAAEVVASAMMTARAADEVGVRVLSRTA